jgi:hypothetical protein
VYPSQNMLDDVQIDTSSYVVVKVDMAHDNSKDLKLKVPPDDTTRDVVARRVQWRQSSIVIDPAATASASTSPALMSPKAHLPPSPNPEQLVLSTIREQLPPIIEKPQKTPIRDRMHPSPILELPQKSPLEQQLCWYPPRTQSTPLPTPDQPHAKAMKNVRAKSHSQQRKMSSKETKGKKPLKELEASLKLPIAMMHANLKFQMGKQMLTVGTLKEAGKSCVVLHNYYINNYKKHQHIIGGFKEKHFLVGEGIFPISWSDLYDLFTLDALDISRMRCFAL